MRVAFRAMIALSAFLCASAAVAEDVIDYEQDETALFGDLSALGASTPSAPPTRGDYDLALDGIERADHEVLSLSMMCRQDIVNPASTLVRSVFATLDRDGTLGSSATEVVTITIETATSTVRTFYDGEMDAQGIARVALRAMLSFQDTNGVTQSEPISARVESIFDSDSACARRVRGVAFATREAVIMLAAEARRVLDEQN